MQTEIAKTPLTSKDQRRPYIKPAIVLEQELETRAGSPLQPGNGLFDPLNTNGG